jgi:hypothetical protein
MFPFGVSTSRLLPEFARVVTPSAGRLTSAAPPVGTDDEGTWTTRLLVPDGKLDTASDSCCVLSWTCTDGTLVPLMVVVPVCSVPI